MTIYKLEPTRNPTDYFFLKGKTSQKDVRGELEEVTPMLFGKFTPHGTGGPQIEDMLTLDLEQGQDLPFLHSVIFDINGKKYIPGAHEIGNSKVIEYQKGSHLIAELECNVLEKAHQTMELLYAMQAYNIDVDPEESAEMWKAIMESVSDQDQALIPQMSQEDVEEMEEQQMRENFDIIDFAGQFVKEFHWLNSSRYNIIEDHSRNPVHHNGVRYPFYVKSHELLSQIGFEKLEEIMKSQPKDFFGNEKKPDETSLIAIVKGDPEKILRQFS